MSVPAVRLNILVQPRASFSAAVGQHGDAIKIRLAAPPVDNAANLELVEFMAKTLRLPKRCVRIICGLSSRRKVVQIEGMSEPDALAALLATSSSA